MTSAVIPTTDHPKVKPASLTGSASLTRVKPKRKKFPAWPHNKKLETISTYLVLGSMTQTALVVGVPYPTIEIWRRTDWWKEYALKLKNEDIQQLDSNLKRIVNKSLKVLEDRIDKGDAQFDQKTGEIVRVPIKAHVALKISSELLEQKRKLDSAPIREDIEKTVDARLLKLAEEFSRFSSMKTIEVQAKELPT
jgi:uncharacterized protein (DUF4415 family)